MAAITENVSMVVCNFNISLLVSYVSLWTTAIPEECWFQIQVYNQADFKHLAAAACHLASYFFNLL